MGMGEPDWQEWIEELEERTEELERQAEIQATMESSLFVPLLAPLTSTSYDGDAFSTTAKTLIDLSAVFGTPAEIGAVLVRYAIRDSGSAANDCYLILAPNNTANQGPAAGCSGLANDAWARGELIVPCNADGDIYYQIGASGAGTFDLSLQVWGYWR
jgi:hypothetical protein